MVVYFIVLESVCCLFISSLNKRKHPLLLGFLFKLSKIWSKVSQILNISAQVLNEPQPFTRQYFVSLSSKTNIKIPTWLWIFPSEAAAHLTTSHLLLLYFVNDFCQQPGFIVPLLPILEWRKPNVGPLGCFAGSEKRETFHQTVKALNSAPSLEH